MPPANRTRVCQRCLTALPTTTRYYPREPDGELHPRCHNCCYLAQLTPDELRTALAARRRPT